MPPATEPTAPSARRGAARAHVWRAELADGGTLVVAAVALVLFILWSAHDGGFDADTWYWGALVMLALLAAMVSGAFGRLARLSRPVCLALLAFALYVLWSYASMAWAAYPGAALEGSNRALLYLILFAALALVRWTPRRALWMLTAYCLGIGVIALLVLFDMAGGQNIGGLFSEGRLVTATGYFNSNAALFMTLALTGTALSVRRELPPVLRGMLLGLACAGLQLALLAESRGWLFTLPVVIALAVLAVRDRLKTGIAAVLPVAGFLVVLSRLLDVYRATEVDHPQAAVVNRAVEHAGQAGLVACFLVMFLGVLGAGLAPRIVRRRPAAGARRLVGTVAVAVILLVAVVGGSAATHGHPIRFINQQWYGFTHPSVTTTTGSSSHFDAVGSERYDFWRVALKAFVSHPIGGLGQDNYADYYVRYRHTGVEPEWAHSLEMRLLAHTGLVGAALFVVFLAAALTGAVKGRGREPMAAAVSTAALLPLIVWLIHGSIDWFWEIPALSGPALGFLAMAGALTGASERAESAASPSRARVTLPPIAVRAGAVLALIAAVVVLGFPYLAQRELSIGSNLRSTDVSSSLAAFHRASELNPLSSDPARFAGTAALQAGQYRVAVQRFAQAIHREPGGWFSYLGAGLAESALGDRRAATFYLVAAKHFNHVQPAVVESLNRMNSGHPLSPQQALNLLVLAH
jgi:hypothetical protein